MTSTIQAQIPLQLLSQAETLVKEGWIADLNTLVAEALRRFLESHQSQLTEAFIKDDVRWGLHEKD